MVALALWSPARCTGSDTTMSPSKGAGGAGRKHARGSDDLSEGAPPHLPSQNPPGVYYDASQQSGRQGFK